MISRRVEEKMRRRDKLFGVKSPWLSMLRSFLLRFSIFWINAPFKRCLHTHNEVGERVHVLIWAAITCKSFLMVLSTTDTSSSRMQIKNNHSNMRCSGFSSAR